WTCPPLVRWAAKETAMIELTAEQRKDLDGEEPARARDPQTGQTYVLVRSDFYEKVRKVIDGMTRRAGWDEPSLDDYEIDRTQPTCNAGRSYPPAGRTATGAGARCGRLSSSSRPTSTACSTTRSWSRSRPPSTGYRGRRWNLTRRWKPARACCTCPTPF